jgi:hypothetical protein
MDYAKWDRLEDSDGSDDADGKKLAEKKATLFSSDGAGM